MPDAIRNVTPAPEIKEQRTSFLGYFLLIVMFVATLSTGFEVLGEVDSLVDRPHEFNRCLSLRYGEQYYGTADHRYQSRNRLVHCDFTNAGLLPPRIQELIGSLKHEVTLIALNKQLKQDRAALKNTQAELDTYANVSQSASLKQGVPIEGVNGAHVGVEKTFQYRERLKTQIANNDIHRQQLLREDGPVLSQLSRHIALLKEQEKEAKFYYDLKVMFLQLVLTGILFGAALWQWKRLKAKNSPYTIIWSTVTASQSILFVWVLGGFIWSYLPHRFMAQLLSFISASEVLQYLAYLLYMLLPILILGGIVWWIQKRLYAPYAVATRRLNKQQCPSCGFHLTGVEQKHCPSCQHRLRSPCRSCEHGTYRDLPYCEGCGIEQPVQVNLTGAAHESD